MQGDSEAGLHVADVSRRFGRRWAVARASFSLAPGERLMLTGANGSGKTTLLRCLATALKPDHGEMRLAGECLWTHRDRHRAAIAYFSHAPRLYDDLNATDNLKVWARLGEYSIDPHSLLEQVGLPPDRTEPVRTFSAGMRRRLAFARILMQKPRLVLLDEPFSALDPEGRTHLVKLVDTLCGDQAVLIVATHLPRTAISLCHHGIHMEAGQITWRGTHEDHPLLQGAS